MKQRFALGRTTTTPDALDAMLSAGVNPAALLTRHAAGDFGDLDDSDKRANEEAIRYEGDEERQERVLSAYTLPDGESVWIVTEHDRSVTTILLPFEY